MPIRRDKDRGGEESIKALRDAKEHLEAAKARTPEVERVARAMRIMRERNRFAERLQTIMGGPHL